MRRCIICASEKEDTAFSDEHVFPEAIGGTFKIKSVCRECNSRLGSLVDVHLTDHAFVHQRRNMLSLPGKSGKVPDPLAEGRLVGSPELKVHEIIPGPLRVIPHVSRVALPDNSERVRITMDARAELDLVAAVNKVLSRRGLPPKTANEIRPFIRHETDPAPKVAIDVTVDLVRYKLALVKIAYELAATWIGDVYLTDPVAVEFQRALLADEPMKLRPAISYVGKINLRDPTEPLPDGGDANHHVACLLPLEGQVIATLRVFDLFEAVIVMSEHAERYPSFSGRILNVDPVGRVHDERGF